MRVSRGTEPIGDIYISYIYTYAYIYTHTRTRVYVYINVKGLL